MCNGSVELCLHELAKHSRGLRSSRSSSTSINQSREEGTGPFCCTNMVRQLDVFFHYVFAPSLENTCPRGLWRSQAQNSSTKTRNTIYDTTRYSNNTLSDRSVLKCFQPLARKKIWPKGLWCSRAQNSSNEKRKPCAACTMDTTKIPERSMMLSDSTFPNRSREQSTWATETYIVQEPGMHLVLPHWLYQCAKSMMPRAQIHRLLK